MIFVLALLIFGPRKLPEIAKGLGKAMRMFREASDEVKRTLEEDIQAERMREIRETKARIRKKAQEHKEQKAKEQPSTDNTPENNGDPITEKIEETEKLSDDFYDEGLGHDSEEELDGDSGEEHGENFREELDKDSDDNSQTLPSSDNLAG